MIDIFESYYKKLEDTSLKESIRLTSNNIPMLRAQIGRDAHIYSGGIILHENGRFDIYNVSETDVKSWIRRLEELPYVEYCSATPVGYDFSHFENYGQPKRNYHIQGQLNLESIFGK